MVETGGLEICAKDSALSGFSGLSSGNKVAFGSTWLWSARSVQYLCNINP